MQIYQDKVVLHFNSLGLEVRSNKSDANVLNISLNGLESGAYFIKIPTDKGSATKRFIIN